MHPHVYVRVLPPDLEGLLDLSMCMDVCQCIHMCIYARMHPCGRACMHMHGRIEWLGRMCVCVCTHACVALGESGDCNLLDLSNLWAALVGLPRAVSGPL